MNIIAEATCGYCDTAYARLNDALECEQEDRRRALDAAIAEMQEWRAAQIKGGALVA